MVELRQQKQGKNSTSESNDNDNPIQIDWDKESMQIIGVDPDRIVAFVAVLSLLFFRCCCCCCNQPQFLLLVLKGLIWRNVVACC